MSLVASLPMYRFDHTRDATDALWRQVARELQGAGIDAPAELSDPQDLDAHWRSPDLLLSQTCSMPYRQGLNAHVSVLGSWDLGLKACPAGAYNSVLIRRRRDARPWRELLGHARVAMNSRDSQSGYQVVCDLAGDPGDRAHVTGAHWASVKAVRNGEADICAVDAESWRLIVEAERGALGVEVCHRSDPTPGLPLITARGRDCATLRAALTAALSGADRTVLATLHIRGFIAAEDADYA